MGISDDSIPVAYEVAKKVYEKKCIKNKIYVKNDKKHLHSYKDMNLYEN